MRGTWRKQHVDGHAVEHDISMLLDYFNLYYFIHKMEHMPVFSRLPNEIWKTLQQNETNVVDYQQAPSLFASLRIRLSTFITWLAVHCFSSVHCAQCIVQYNAF